MCWKALLNVNVWLFVLFVLYLLTAAREMCSSRQINKDVASLDTAMDVSIDMHLDILIHVSCTLVRKFNWII